MKKFIYVAIVCLIVGMLTGYKIGGLLIKPQIIEKERVVSVPMELDDPQIIQMAIDNVSQKYGIRKEVFSAIIKCEGGTVFGWNKTNDGGLFQINWQTAKQYGAQSLKDIIDPRYSTELAANILLKEGLKPWKTRDCIEQELIKITK